jgi:hypothetical protein
VVPGLLRCLGCPGPSLGRRLGRGSPITRIEQSAEQRAAAALSCYLGVGQAAAAYYARRCILFHRDQVLHEALVLDLPAHRIPDILSSVKAVGADQLATLDPSRGIVLVSLHYGLYSSMLIWWLAQATARKLFKKLTVLMRSNPTGQYLVSSRRLEDFEAAGVWSRGVTLVDRTVVGPYWNGSGAPGPPGPRRGGSHVPRRGTASCGTADADRDDRPIRSLPAPRRCVARRDTPVHHRPGLYSASR